MIPQEERDDIIAKNAIRILATTYDADVNQIIDLLTGYIWDEEDAYDIKNTLDELE